MTGIGGLLRTVGWVGVGLLPALVPAVAAPPTGELVPTRSAVRLQAVATLSTFGAPSVPCFTVVAQTARYDHQRVNPAARRAIAVLANDPGLISERVATDGRGVIARFTTDRNSPDRVEVLDDNANGRPDAVDAALAGIARAQGLLHGQLELPNPGAIEIILGRLGSDADGVSVPLAGGQTRTRIWLDPTIRGGSVTVRRSAEHQYAHSVAAAAGLDPEWGEAFAAWTALVLEGSPDERAVALIGGRLAALGAGLVTEDLDLAAGNAAWFAFLQESYGPTAIKLAVEELGRGGSDRAALDRAIRRATGSVLDAALRDFQLWSLLVGPRDDRRHFSFAARLPGPTFAASADALPALSVQADPEVAPMGSAAVLIRPGERTGGLSVRFEGDVAAHWTADLLLVRDDGTLHRVPFALDTDAAADLSIPLQDVREVLLLIRNGDAEGHPGHRYSWAAHLEPGFPAEFASIRAEPVASGRGVLVSWETSTEREIVGFNVLRARSDRDEARVNPVWIPSVGEASGPAAYSFFDAEAQPGVAYHYRVEAVTLEGLASRSEAVALDATP